MAQAFLEVCPLREDQQPIAAVGKEVAIRWTKQTGIAVGGGQPRSAPQQVNVLPQALLTQGFLLGGKAVQLFGQAVGKLGRAVQKLPHRRDLHLLHAVLPTLGLRRKGGDGIHLITPEFQSHGVAVLRGVKVHNAAAGGKLPDALHLLGALVACLHQKIQQPLGRVFLADPQGEGSGGKLLRRQGGL